MPMSTCVGTANQFSHTSQKQQHYWNKDPEDGNYAMDSNSNILTPIKPL